MRRQILKRRLAYGEENVVVVLCNPNTADDKMDDHTTTKCMNFFRNKGYSLMTFVNLFAIRSAHPKELRNVFDPARIPLKLVQFRQASADAIEAQRLEKKNRKEVKQLLDDLISVILENLS